MRPLLVLLLLLASCGQTVGTGEGRVVQVRAPDLPARTPVLETLEPPPAPTPTPTPAPPPPPMDPPRSARILAKSGGQEGSVAPHCWSRGDGRTTCVEDEQTMPVPPLAVARGERVRLRIEAEGPPTEQTIRPFQGSREGYPEQKLSPALDTALEMILDPGTWEMDVCAAWRGHGRGVCWLFRFEVDA